MGVYNSDAQNNKEKRLQIVYIDHEVTTPTKELNSRMTQRFYDVVQYPDQESLVLYLSNGRRSPIAFVNLKEYATDEQLKLISASGQRRDTEDAFKDVLETMNKANSHTVEPLIDINNILSLLEQLQVFDENGRLNFKSLRFDFYIGPQFWLLRNNEKIISRIYAILNHGLKDEDKDKLSFNVFKPANSKLEYTEGKPFGEANLNGINEKLSIMEY
jgi:hypothetical protein